MLLDQKLLTIAEQVNTEQEAQDFFQYIADTLFNQYLLLTRQEIYRLQEIEFYLYTTNHPDTTSHNNERHHLFGQWYVHRYGKFASSPYATFTSKVGMGLTLGSEKVGFGILFRGIYQMPEGPLISGPIKSLNALYGSTYQFMAGSQQYQAYLEYSHRLEQYTAFDHQGLLFLQPAKQLHHYTPYFTVRTGLNLQRHPEFARRNYKAYIQIPSSNITVKL